MTLARRLAPAVLMAWLLMGCEPTEPPTPAPPEVTVATPERRDVTRYAEYTGRTRATEFAEIRARVSGSLDAMLFEPSVVVEEGQVLFEIEPDTYQATYDGAVAQLASANSQLANAEADLGRIEEAIRERAVSQSDLDLARATRDSAEALVLTAEARLQQASIDLNYTKVTSPIAGQVSRNFVDVGNLVGVGEPTLLTTVTRIQPIFVYFDAPENLVLQMLEARQTNILERDEDMGTVLVATAADEGFPNQGEIDYVDNTVDPGTGTIELRASLPNTKAALFPGLFVRVRVLMGHDPAALVVNERALGTDLGGKYVLLVGEGDVVEQRYVTLGPLQDDGMVVVDEGLDGSERYIVEGLLRARPGLPVTPETDEPDQASPTSSKGEIATSDEG